MEGSRLTLGMLAFSLFMCSSTSEFDRIKRNLLFGDASSYGTFLAIAVPVDIPDKNVFVSYNFEGIYLLPTNVSQFADLNPLQSAVVSSRGLRSINRKTTYDILEQRFYEHGIPARECLLRNICEAAETPLGHNGVLGHILHVVFTPSSSQIEDLDPEFYEAELNGWHGSCEKYFKECKSSLFDSITRVAE